MRERIRQLVSSARRVTRTEPADHATPQSSPIVCAGQPGDLGAEAVRLARIAAALHMDQAANLRARMAASNESAAARSQASDPVTVEVSR